MKLWRNKWFILVCLVILFFMATGVRVMAAGTDIQLAKILEAGTAGLKTYFDWLLQVLGAIW